MRRSVGRIALAAFVAGLTGAASAPGAGPDVWKEKPQKSALTSGIPVIFHQDKSSPMTVVGLFAPGGRAAVPEGLDGLAFLTTRLTLEIPDEGKVRDLMAQATRMTYLCEEDCSFVFIECLSANLEDALRVAGKIIQDPLMTGIRIGRAKDMMELMAKAEEDDAVVTGGNAALKAFFQGKGYGSSSYGTEASRKAIERKDVLAFFRRHFTAKNVFFCVASDLEAAQVRALLEKYFAKFPEGERPEVLSPAPALPADRDVRSVKDTKQTYMSRSYALPAPATPADHAKGLLLEVLIGQGPGSRLWDLRTAGRLAYNVDSRVTWTRGGGVLEAFLETENAKADRAAESLDKTLRELWEKGVSSGELEATKTMARAGFLRSAEMKATRTRILGGFEVLGLGFEHISGLFEALDAVTLEDLNAYIRSVLDPERALRINVGPEGPGPSKG